MKQVLVIVSLLCSINSSAQNVAINNDGSPPNPRSILDIKSTDKGVFLPRMSSAQRKAIAVHPSDAGLLVFDTDNQTVYIFNGSKWVPMQFTSERNLPGTVFQPATLTAGSAYGNHVALDGNWAVVSDHNVTVGSNSQQGMVYIYKKTNSGWQQHQTLTSPDGSILDWFGSSVAISDGWLAVGAYADDIDASGRNEGSVYMFRLANDNWQYAARLVASDRDAGDYFGSSVSIDGSTLVVGASGDDVGANIAEGSVYIFYQSGDNWLQSGKLTSSDGTSSDRFGSSVDIHGSTIVVGAPRQRIGNIARQGSAYVFKRNGALWNQTHKLTHNQPAMDDEFGHAVAIYNDRIVVGIPGYDITTSETGAATVFRYDAVTNSWGAHAHLQSSTLTSNEQFGSSVDINGEFILVGRPMSKDHGFPFAGSVNVFTYGVNTPTTFYRTIYPAEIKNHQYFGIACALNRSTHEYLVGALGHSGTDGLICFGFVK